MKHMIVGSGTLGISTGTWLEANGEEVIYNDINADLITKLIRNDMTVSVNVKAIRDVDIYWICTMECDVDNAIRGLPHPIGNSIVVIRSTNPPCVTDALAKQFNIEYIAHVPEFLRASTAISDMFNPDFVVIGARKKRTREKLGRLFKNLFVPIIYTDPVTSELIQLISNAWFSTQVSFWNQVFKISKAYEVNPEQVANVVTLDKRVSKCGSDMLGTPFGGAYLPKDLDSLIVRFNSKNLEPTLLKAVKEVNKKMGADE